MKPRILILTSSTGSGHDLRAYAIRDWMARLYADKIEVRVDHVLERSGTIGSFGVWLYNTIQRTWPWLHNFYWMIVELIFSGSQNKVPFGRRYYRQLITDFRPHLIISMHDSLNCGYFEDAVEWLKPHPVACVTYCGEWSGGFGFSRNWVNPRADHFFARTEHARQHAISLGMPAEKTSVFRKLLPPKDFDDNLDSDDYQQFLTQELGLRPHLFTLLLATGLNGSNHHIRFLRHLLPLAGKVQVIVVCGRNHAVFQKVQLWHKQHPHLGVHIEGYCKRMQRLLQVSDAVVSRPGSNTSAEALHFKCPVIYNTLGGVMPQERLTLKFFAGNGAAPVVRKAKDLAVLLDSWHSRGDDYLNTKQRLLDLRIEETPEAFIDGLVQRAKDICFASREPICVES